MYAMLIAEPCDRVLNVSLVSCRRYLHVFKH